MKVLALLETLSASLSGQMETSKQHFYIFSLLFFFLPISLVLLFFSFLYIQAGADVNRCEGWARRGRGRREKQFYSSFSIPEQRFLLNEIRATWYGARTQGLGSRGFHFQVCHHLIVELWPNHGFIAPLVPHIYNCAVIYIREWLFPWSHRGIQMSGINNGIMILVEVLSHQVLSLHFTQDEMEGSFLIPQTSLVASRSKELKQPNVHPDALRASPLVLICRMKSTAGRGGGGRVNNLSITSSTSLRWLFIRGVSFWDRAHRGPVFHNRALSHWWLSSMWGGALWGSRWKLLPMLSSQHRAIM